MLPWYVAQNDEAIALMGSDFWPFGVLRNVKTLETFLDYHHDQGLSKRRVEVAELFAPELLDT